MTTTWPLVIEVPIRPIGKGRPRFGRGHAYTPEKTRKFEQALGWEAKIAMKGRPLIEGPLKINIIACFETKTKKEFLTWRTKKPDFDNIYKTLDCFNNVVFKDDSQIADAHIKKINGKRDFLRIEIEPLTALCGE